MSFDFGQDWLILLTFNDGAYNVKSRYRAVPCNDPSKIDWNWFIELIRMLLH